MHECIVQDNSINDQLFHTYVCIGCSAETLDAMKRKKGNLRISKRTRAINHSYPPQKPVPCIPLLCYRHISFRFQEIIAQRRFILQRKARLSIHIDFVYQSRSITPRLRFPVDRDTYGTVAAPRGSTLGITINEGWREERERERSSTRQSGDPLPRRTENTTDTHRHPLVHGASPVSPGRIGLHDKVWLLSRGLLNSAPPHKYGRGLQCRRYRLRLKWFPAFFDL